VKHIGATARRNSWGNWELGFDVGDERVPNCCNRSIRRSRYRSKKIL